MSFLEKLLIDIVFVVVPESSHGRQAYGQPESPLLVFLGNPCYEQVGSLRKVHGVHEFDLPVVDHCACDILHRIYPSISMESGSSSWFLMATRKRTASLPSTMRWS